MGTFSTVAGLEELPDPIHAALALWRAFAELNTAATRLDLGEARAVLGRVTDAAFHELRFLGLDPANVWDERAVRAALEAVEQDRADVAANLLSERRVGAYIT